MPRHRRGMNGASLTGLVNAEARSQDEVRSNVRFYFGTLLAIAWIVDVASACGVVWLSCDTDCDDPPPEETADGTGSRSATALRCFASSVGAAAGKWWRQRKHRADNNNDDDELGDFVVMALVRCLSTAVLLWVGVRYGREGRRFRPSATASATDANDEGPGATMTVEEDPMSEPLLASSPSSAGHPEEASTDRSPRENLPSGGSNETAMASASTTTTTTTNTEPSSDSLTSSSSSWSWSISSVKGWWSSIIEQASDPERVRSAVLLLVFVSCTLYQVYAGLRVATMGTTGSSGSGSGQHDDDCDHDDALPHWKSSLRIVLVCSTILWINAEAYIVRVLVVELTREVEGLLFLPPEVHRHPLYLETDKRAMAFHWCDLCQQRIGTSDPTPTVCRPVTTGSNGNNNSNAAAADPKKGWAYRCALCDFDICIKCSKRNDAATVGENVLRGDRGVRAETSLTTSQYVKRSIAVAGRSEWPWLLASFALLAVSSLSKLFLPHFQGKIIDKVIPVPYHPGHGDGGDDDEHNGDTYYDKKGFLHYIFVYVLVMLAQGFVSTLYSAIFTLVSRRLKFTIRNALLEKILAQDVAYFDGTESGRLISRLTNDLDMMMSPIQSSLSMLLSNCLILIGGMGMCFFKSYRLSMLAFVCIGPISYLWEQYALWSKKLAREMLSYWAQGNSIASQALSHIRTVKAFGCEDVVLKKYSETNQMALNCGIKDAWGNGLTSALTGYLDLGTGVLILYFGGLLVYEGEMSVGDLVTYQLFWNMMNNAYQSLQGLVTSFTRSAAGAEKVFSLWDSDPDIDPRKGSDIDVDAVEGHLRLEGVSFYYQMRPDNLVLEGFDLDVPAGKTLALVGRSGGGKSTIINLLLRFYDPKEGRVLLDGKPYDSLKVHQLRRLFGVVTQDTELFALTVEENIAYGLNKEDYTSEEVAEAAKKAYAHDFIMDMKDGYQTRIGERGGRISGGQRQRLAIARVFLRKPRIILLDEATSALDETSQEAVQTALKDLIESSGSTVVMVAHRLSTVVHADCICVVDKGRVLERGNHEHLLTHHPTGIYASMVAKQFAKKSDLLDQDQPTSDGGSSAAAKSGGGGGDTIDDLLAD